MSEPPDKGGGIVARLLDLVSGVDSIKKALALIITLAALLVGYITYEHRHELAVSVARQWGAVELDESAIDPAATSFMTESGAITVSVWSADLARNDRHAVYRRTLEGRDNNLAGMRDVLLRTNSQLTAPVIDLINGRTVCFDSHLVAGISHEPEVHYLCAAAIPPENGSDFVGIVLAGFSEPPAREDFVKLRLVQVAQRVIR